MSVLLVDVKDRTISPLGLAVMLLPGNPDIIQEVFAFFGPKNESMAFEFLATFGGRTIRFPPAKELKESLLSVQAYMRCEEISKDKPTLDRKAVIDRVAKELRIEAGRVSAAWSAVKRRMVKLEREVTECLAELKRRMER